LGNTTTRGFLAVRLCTPGIDRPVALCRRAAARSPERLKFYVHRAGNRSFRSVRSLEPGDPPHADRPEMRKFFCFAQSAPRLFHTKSTGVDSSIINTEFHSELSDGNELTSAAGLKGCNIEQL
jgi:hypothetical protein